MLQLTSLSGKRESKEMQEPYVITSPVEGEIKISPKVAAKLGIGDGDRVMVAGVPTEDGKHLVYIGKGKNGEPVLDDEGNPTFDDRGREIFVKNTSFGSIARPITPGSTTLKITVTAAWTQLEGSENHNRFFEIGEGQEAQVPTPVKDYPVHTTEVFELSYVKEETKAGYEEDENGNPVVKEENAEVAPAAEVEEEEEI